MIKVKVMLENDSDSRCDEVVITKEELLQYACNKAREKYLRNHWTISFANKMEISINCT